MIPDPVRAAGGVVWRREGDELEVLLVHRPKYRDWGFPKGKHDPDETDEECALREVEEETGLRCEIEGELGGTRYVNALGEDKIVRYYVMRPLGGAFTPHAEIDDARWLALPEARRMLTYDRDRDLLARFAAVRGRAMPRP